MLQLRIQVCAYVYTNTFWLDNSIASTVSLDYIWPLNVDTR
jgi:hypothetical protein